MATPATRSDRVPLRLAVTDSVHAGPLDGAWWPQSRDLGVEAADLVDHFPGPVGHVARLLYSRPDWEPDPSGAALRKIHARRGPVKAGSFPSDDTHVMVAVLSSGTRLRLVVVPSAFGEHDAARVMSAAADEANRRSAGELLQVAGHDQAHLGHRAWDELEG